MSIIYTAELPIKIGNNEGWIVNEVMTLHGVPFAEVLDLAGCLWKTVKVELNGRLIRVTSFRDYADLHLKSAEKSRPLPLPRFHAKVGDRWEICVNLSDGQFQHVSFVNLIDKIKGGTHVDYVTNEITTYVMNKVNKKKKYANVKAHSLKNRLGETDGTKTQRVRGIVKLEDANDAGRKDSDKCTLILTEGDSIAGLSVVGREHYGVFLLRGKLLNVREATSKQIMENEEIQNIKKIRGLQQNKE
ncbi:hypothetical protein L6164_006399 [Bauhinia variegata]|uniref:Uncharacterized protein n=1 Tax=Bauhinia variegata TaxID=167791 RepID=A0ACB9PUA4_BAUVA|nr:hypothetical protein L6164_006399 [Bauhinia variegata]